MKKLSAGVWGGMTVLAIGGIFLGYSLTYTYSSDIGPGPGFFPTWLSGGLVGLAAIYLYEALRGKDSYEGLPDKKGLMNILFILMCMALYALFLRILGFNVCSAAFLFALLFKAYRWWVNLAISIGTVIFLFVLFQPLLGVQLPVNALGF